MAKALSNATIRTHLSSTRGHSDHGWLNTYHSFSFADWYHPSYVGYGSLRVLNEDRVAPNSGFPMHPHRDYEIFSYVMGGELTHRDSTMKNSSSGEQSDKFYRMHRGDVQFTTGGKGVTHSEFNEHDKDTVHFLQIWVKPWANGLEPRYHTRNFPDEVKRRGFVPILSPLRAGPKATSDEEAAAEPVVPDTIPIHADFAMGAGLIEPGKTFEWPVGGGEGVTENKEHKVLVHVAMTAGGKAKVKLDGREDAVLGEGDGAFVETVVAGDLLRIESVGEAEAEVVVLDTA